MPPRSISSAIALVGLCSLAAVETGGCSNSPKSLASVTRTGLPMLSAWLRGPLGQLSLTKFSRADAAKNPDSEFADANSGSEHGLGSMSEIQPHCGRYELRDNGKVVAWDALTSTRSAQLLTVELANHTKTLKWTALGDGSYTANRMYLGRAQQLDVRAASKAQLPENCRALGRDAQSVLFVSESL